MSEIRCPHCNTPFQLEESVYQEIVNQVKNQEFTKLLNQQMEQAQREFALQLQQHDLLADSKHKETSASYELRIQQLEAKLSAAETQQTSALQAQQLQQATDMSEKNAEIITLKQQLQLVETTSIAQVQTIKESYESKLKEKDEMIGYYKDLKTKMSTKMVGETLEQHCQIQFNQMRAVAFPNAYFEKDNDAKTGSKGDFIYREQAGEVELLSIMFEMKNEMDTTATKHHNEDFLKELDKDRREKNCEYAVLVSMLEADNDLYNAGIVDMSYRYPKMFVVRPQSFLAIIGLLRNGALGALEAKQSLIHQQQSEIDVRNFENELNDFKANISRNYTLYSTKFDAAIEEIDKAIDRLTKVKQNLLSSSNNLRILNNKVDDMSVRKLTRNNPTMKQAFLDVQNQTDE